MCAGRSSPGRGLDRIQVSNKVRNADQLARLIDAANSVPDDTEYKEGS